MIVFLLKGHWCELRWEGDRREGGGRETQKREVNRLRREVTRENKKERKRVSERDIECERERDGQRDRERGRERKRV